MNTNSNQRLREWRLSTNLTQRELASRLGVSQSFVGNIEAGRSEPSRNFLRKLTETFDVSADWLLYGIGGMIQKSGTESFSLPVPSDDIMRHMRDFKLIPRMELCVSAGTGLVPVDDEYAGALAFSDTWIKKNSINAQLSVLVSVKGDSMAPTIPDGALVLVHLPENHVEREGIYAFNRADCSFIKRLVPSSLDKSGRPGSLAIISNNPAYPPEVVTGKDMNEIHIVGRVRYVMTTL